MNQPLLLSEEGHDQRAGRRGFLRSLVIAPVAALATHKLILPATASATPLAAAMNKVDREDLLNAYDCWLDGERHWLAWERAAGDSAKFRAYRRMIVFEGHRAGAYHDNERAPASSRALTVLAAAGCDWRDSEARS